MKTYKIIDIIGNFDLLVDKEIKASDEEAAKKLIMDDIKNNIEKYLYPAVEVEDEV